MAAHHLHPFHHRLLRSFAVYKIYRGDVLGLLRLCKSMIYLRINSSVFVLFSCQAEYVSLYHFFIFSVLLNVSRVSVCTALFSS